jgi:hypothetical protein
MGWLAITRKNEIIREGDGITESNPGGGRPVDAGNNNELIVVGAEEYGHKVAIDLVNGVVALDFDSIGVQNGTIELTNARFIFSICEETNIVGEFKHRRTSKPDKAGNYTIDYEPLIFRPIWFNRMISTLPGPVIVIGAQVTTPKEQGRRNIKKMVSLFPDGRVGIS